MVNIQWKFKVEFIPLNFENLFKILVYHDQEENYFVMYLLIWFVSAYIKKQTFGNYLKYELIHKPVQNNLIELSIDEIINLKKKKQKN